MKSFMIFPICLICAVSMACNLPAGSIEPTPTLESRVEPSTAAMEIPPMQSISETLTPSLTPTASVTLTSTVSPTPSVPTALFLMNANCRSGPAKSKTAVMSFLEGESAEILGRNNEFDDTWWLVKIPNSKDTCWVSTITVQVIGSYDDIPTLPPPY